MVTSPFVPMASATYGRKSLIVKVIQSSDMASGAYCALTIISILNLPLELPPDSPARVKGDETFLTGLYQWISRCQSRQSEMLDTLLTPQ